MAEGRAPPRRAERPRRGRGCRGGPSSSEEGRAPPRERAAAWPGAEPLRDGAEMHLPHLTELGATWDSTSVHRCVAKVLLSVHGPFAAFCFNLRANLLRELIL